MLRWTVAKFGTYLTLEFDGVTRNLLNMGMGMPTGQGFGLPMASAGYMNTFNTISAQQAPPPLPYKPAQFHL